MPRAWLWATISTAAEGAAAAEGAVLPVVLGARAAERRAAPVVFGAALTDAFRPCSATVLA